MATKRYTVKTPVNFNQEEFVPGDPIELDDKTAKDLLEVGAIEPATSAASSAAGGPASEEKLDAIKAVIGELDKEDATAWLKDGKPKTEAIAALTGWPVSAAERDAAWAALQG